MLNAAPSSERDFIEIKRAERQLAEAHLTLNLGTFDRLLHPEYVILQPGGKIEHKTEVLSSSRDGRRHWSTARTDQLEMKIYGDTGIVTGPWWASGQNGEQRFNYAARFLSVWIRADGRWQNIAYQSTEIDKK